MIRRWHWVVLFVAASALPVAAQTASPAARQPVQPTRSPQAQSNATLDRAESLLAAGHWQAAHDLIVPWLKSNPKASDRDRGVFLLARVYYQNGDRLRAFYHLDELMDDFPESRLFVAALQLQFDIADAYLNGFKDTFLGLPVVSMTDEAIEMLYRIQERSPGSPLAERALKITADYYFNTSQFDLARDAYGMFVRGYPRSPKVPQVRLREAFASLAEFRGSHFDATSLIDARAQFKDIQSRYPELAIDNNVAGWIDRIDADLAHKAYITGDFYRRTNHPRGATYMYRYVIATYPDSREATQARQALAKMPAWALAGPLPPPSNPEAAATQPVGNEGAPGSSERVP